jgi:isopenicillin N synthase-like dioxygenase
MASDRPFRTAKTDEFPIIDIGAYLAGEPGALETLADQVGDALESVGFMMWVGHGLDWDIVDRAFDGARQFHHLPLDEKMRLRVNEHQIGYVPMNFTFNESHSVDSTKGLKRNASENLTYYQERPADDPKVVSGERFRGLNQWPGEDAAPGFQQSQVAYHAMMSALGYRMLPIYARALGMPDDYFAEYFKDPTLVVRMIRYPAVGELRSDQFGSASHTDAGFITMLPQSNERGLQIKTPAGEWVDQPMVTEGVIVNSGNMLKRWSNDRFIATPHRVTTSVGQDRYSLPFFFNPDLDDLIVPVESCCGPDNPVRYEPLLYRDFYTDYLAKTYTHYQTHDAAE